MTSRALPSYLRSGGWRDYQRFFPTDVALTEAHHLPVEQWWRWRGLDIHLDRFEPEQPAASTVVLIHGAGGYGRLFAPLARMLREQGHAVVAPDLPGYGLSRAAARWIDYRHWRDLLIDLIAHEHAAHDRPVVLFGGSIGGYLAYLCAAQSAQVAGLIATTLADPRQPTVQRDLARNRLLRAGLPLLPALARISGGVRLPIRWFTHMQRMSRDPALTALVCRDPLGGGNRVPLGLLASLFDTAPAVEPEQFQQCPVLMVHPALDHWTPVAGSDLFFERLRVPKRRVLLDNCGHFPVESPGLQQLRCAVLDFLQGIVEPPITQSTAGP